MLLLALILLAALWELYKLVIPDDGVRPRRRADPAAQRRHLDAARVGDLGAFGRPELAGAAARWRRPWRRRCWYSLRLAAAGFAVGVVIGFLLALAMQRLRTVERALLPYVVLSQTVPLIALAPLVYGWSGNLTLFGLDWQPWMSVSAISAYLAFFPVAVGALRGLSSPPAVQIELLRCYAAVVVADARPAPAARVGAVPDPGAAAGGRGRGGRRDRGRDLDRPAGRHRAADHHLRPAGDRATRRGSTPPIIGAAVMGLVAVGRRRAARRRAAPLPAPRGGDA